MILTITGFKNYESMQYKYHSAKVTSKWTSWFLFKNVHFDILALVIRSDWSVTEQRVRHIGFPRGYTVNVKVWNKKDGLITQNQSNVKRLKLFRFLHIPNKTSLPYQKTLHQWKGICFLQKNLEGYNYKDQLQLSVQ